MKKDKVSVRKSTGEFVSAPNTVKHIKNEIEQLLKAKDLKRKFDAVFKSLRIDNYKDVNNLDVLSTMLCWCVQQTKPDDEHTRYVRMALIDKELMNNIIEREYGQFAASHPNATDEERDKAKVLINYNAINKTGSHILLFEILKFMGAINVHSDPKRFFYTYAHIDKNIPEHVRIYTFYVGQVLESFLVKTQIIDDLIAHVTQGKRLRNKSDGTIEYGFVELERKVDPRLYEMLSKENKEYYAQLVKDAPRTWNVVYKTKKDGKEVFANTLQLNEDQIKCFEPFMKAYHDQERKQQEQIEAVKKQTQNAKH